MPELPEVEAGRRLVDKYVVGSRITAVELLEQGGGSRDGIFDEIVCSAEKELRDALLNNKFISANRKGKQLYFQMDRDLTLLMHFGMSGCLVVEGVTAQSYINTKVDTAFPPKFSKLVISFENGKRLAYCDPRRLGRIKTLSGNPLSQPPLSKLARDPLRDGVGPEWVAQMHCHTMPIKSLLLDQEQLLSGIGNYLADEVLYQSGVHPSTSAAAIPHEKARELGAVIERVVATACELTVANKDFPKEWLFHYRWGKGKTGSKMPDGSAIKFEIVGGRTTAIVESKQKKTFASEEGGAKGKKRKAEPDEAPKAKAKAKAKAKVK